MAQTYPLPDTEYVEREASEWIARLNADNVSEDDRAHFEAWLQAHPLHAHAYDAMLNTWERLIAAGPLVRAVAFSESMTDVAHEHRERSVRWFYALLRLLCRQR